MCEVHGGNLVTPTSGEHQKQILNILTKHRGKCLSEKDSLNNGKATFYWPISNFTVY